MKMKSFRTIAASTITISLLGSAALSMPAMAVETTTRYITVSASGTTLVVPDAVLINATVSVLSKTSKEALAALSTTAKEVRNVLKANNVTAKDYATQSVTVNPEYSYPQDGTSPVLTGYRATQSLNITIRTASMAGAIVDALIAAGNDNLLINGVSPLTLNEDKGTDIARGLAVKNAKVKATSYAKLLGIKLGKVIYLDETSTPSVYPVFTSMAKTDAAATQIDLGQQKITVSVTVRWAIG